MIARFWNLLVPSHALRWGPLTNDNEGGDE